MGKFKNDYGLEVAYGRDQSPTTFGGTIHEGQDGRKVVKFDLNLKDLKSGVAVVCPGVTLPKDSMIAVTRAFVTKAGVGAASFDVGIKGKTIDNSNGLVGGCPTADEGDMHEHMDETATAVGILITEPVSVTFTANGDYTDGNVRFFIEYESALTADYYNDQGIDVGATPNHTGSPISVGRR